MQTVEKLTGSAKTAATVTKRKARLEATQERMKARQEKTQARVAKLEEQLQRMKERIAEAKKKVKSVEEYSVALKTKQAAELKAAEDFHAVTLKREQERAKVKAKQGKGTTPPPAGTVETEDGRKANLSKDTVETIKTVLGKRRKGVLEPLNGTDAEKILDAVIRDMGINPTAKWDGLDIFTVRFTGRKTIIFSVEESGLAFETTK